ncbi:MAG: EscU/YscU/HrcU family type III secretion system export apparatus switch protein [Spirochaetales bacterium]|nr:EscU/YscU/HrcU family type III secretion system export apparatus switch protein [Spirochaetales bacterium]
MEKAVAIKYTEDLPAPFILAKGKGTIAKVIKRIAQENNIEIMYLPDLAESLIEIDAGSFIPAEYYKIIAEILIFVRDL